MTDGPDTYNLRGKPCLWRPVEGGEHIAIIRESRREPAGHQRVVLDVKDAGRECLVDTNRDRVEEQG